MGTTVSPHEIFIISVCYREPRIIITGTLFDLQQIRSRQDAIRGLLGYDIGKLQRLREVRLGEVVLVFAEDGGRKRFCRAKVTDLSKLNSGLVVVLLMDKGEIDVHVDLASLYFCPYLYTEQKYPAIYQQYILAGISPSGRGTDVRDGLLKWLHDQLVGKKVTAHIKKCDGPFDSIYPLTPSGIPLASVFKRKEQANFYPESLKGSGMAKVTGPGPSVPGEFISDEQNSSNSTDVNEADWVDFKKAGIMLGFESEIYVTYWEQGPKAFNILFREQKEKFDSLHKELKCLVSSGKVSRRRQPMVMDTVICCSQTLFADKFCRGMVLTEEVNGDVTVFLTDLGVTEIVKQDNLWVLPWEMIKVPVLVTKCRLYGLPSKLDSSVTKKFVEVVQMNPSLKARVVDNSNSYITVKMCTKGQSVLDLIWSPQNKEELTFDCNKRQKAFRSLQYSAGIVFTGVISFLCHKSEVLFIHLEENLGMMEQMEKELQLEANSSKQLMYPVQNDVCLALYPRNNQWYRGIVVDVNSKIQVRYVDYGNEAAVEPWCLRGLLPKFVNYAPGQAIPCRLQYVNMRTVKYEDFTKAFADSAFTVIVKEIVETDKGVVHVVEMFCMHTQRSINQYFVEKMQRSLKEEQKPEQRVSASPSNTYNIQQDLHRHDPQKIKSTNAHKIFQGSSTGSVLNVLRGRQENQTTKTSDETVLRQKHVFNRRSVNTDSSFETDSVKSLSSENEVDTSHANKDTCYGRIASQNIGPKYTAFDTSAKSSNWDTKARYGNQGGYTRSKYSNSGSNTKNTNQHTFMRPANQGTYPRYVIQDASTRSADQDTFSRSVKQNTYARHNDQNISVSPEMVFSDQDLKCRNKDYLRNPEYGGFGNTQSGSCNDGLDQRKDRMAFPPGLEILPGTTKMCRLSYGPVFSNFSVTLVENDVTLSQIRSLMSHEYNNGDEAKQLQYVECGWMVGFCDMKKTWERAVVEGITGSNVRLNLIDCGNIVTAQTHELMLLQPGLQIFPHQAVKCTMIDRNGEPGMIDEHLERRLKSGVFLLHFISRWKDLSWTVQLIEPEGFSRDNNATGNQQPSTRRDVSEVQTTRKRRTVDKEFCKDRIVRILKQPPEVASVNMVGKVEGQAIDVGSSNFDSMDQGASETQIESSTRTDDTAHEIDKFVTSPRDETVVDVKEENGEQRYLPKVTNKKEKHAKDQKVSMVKHLEDKMIESKQMDAEYEGGDALPIEENSTDTKIKRPTAISLKTGDLVYVSYSEENHDVVWLQHTNDGDLLNDLGARIESLVPVLKAPEELVPGMMVLAQSSDDEVWYRGVVESVDSLGITVHFIDYGNNEKVTMQDIREIPSELTEIQALSCKCVMKTKELSDSSDFQFSNLYDQEWCVEIHADTGHVSLKLPAKYQEASVKQTTNDESFCTNRPSESTSNGDFVELEMRDINTSSVIDTDGSRICPVESVDGDVSNFSAISMDLEDLNQQQNILTSANDSYKFAQNVHNFDKTLGLKTEEDLGLNQAKESGDSLSLKSEVDYNPGFKGNVAFPHETVEVSFQEAEQVVLSKTMEQEFGHREEALATVEQELGHQEEVSATVMQEFGHLEEESAAVKQELGHRGEASLNVEQEFGPYEEISSTGIVPRTDEFKCTSRTELSYPVASTGGVNERTDITVSPSNTEVVLEGITETELTVPATDLEKTSKMQESVVPMTCIAAGYDVTEEIKLTLLPTDTRVLDNDDMITKDTTINMYDKSNLLEVPDAGATHLYSKVENVSCDLPSSVVPLISDIEEIDVLDMNEPAVCSAEHFRLEESRVTEPSFASGNENCSVEYFAKEQNYSADDTDFTGKESDIITNSQCNLCSDASYLTEAAETPTHDDVKSDESSFTESAVTPSYNVTIDKSNMTVPTLSPMYVKSDELSTYDVKSDESSTDVKNDGLSIYEVKMDNSDMTEPVFSDTPINSDESSTYVNVDESGMPKSAVSLSDNIKSGEFYMTETAVTSTFDIRSDESCITSPVGTHTNDTKSGESFMTEPDISTNVKSDESSTNDMKNDESSLYRESDESHLKEPGVYSITSDESSITTPSPSHSKTVESHFTETSAIIDVTSEESYMSKSAVTSTSVKSDESQANDNDRSSLYVKSDDSNMAESSAHDRTSDESYVTSPSPSCITDFEFDFTETSAITDVTGDEFYLTKSAITSTSVRSDESSFYARSDESSLYARSDESNFTAPSARDGTSDESYVTTPSPSCSKNFESDFTETSVVIDAPSDEPNVSPPEGILLESDMTKSFFSDVKRDKFDVVEVRCSSACDVKNNESRMTELSVISSLEDKGVEILVAEPVTTLEYDFRTDKPNEPKCEVFYRDVAVDTCVETGGEVPPENDENEAIQLKVRQPLPQFGDGRIKSSEFPSEEYHTDQAQVIRHVMPCAEEVLVEYENVKDDYGKGEETEPRIIQTVCISEDIPEDNEAQKSKGSSLCLATGHNVFSDEYQLGQNILNAEIDIKIDYKESPTSALACKLAEEVTLEAVLEYSALGYGDTRENGSRNEGEFYSGKLLQIIEFVDDSDIMQPDKSVSEDSTFMKSDTQADTRKNSLEKLSAVAELPELSHNLSITVDSESYRRETAAFSSVVGPAAVCIMSKPHTDSESSKCENSTEPEESNDTERKAEGTLGGLVKALGQKSIELKFGTDECEIYGTFDTENKPENFNKEGEVFEYERKREAVVAECEDDESVIGKIIHEGKEKEAVECKVIESKKVAHEYEFKSPAIDIIDDSVQEVEVRQGKASDSTNNAQQPAMKSRPEQSIEALAKFVSSPLQLPLACVSLKDNEDKNELIHSYVADVELTEHREDKSESFLSGKENVEFSKHIEDESKPIPSHETSAELTKHSEDISEPILSRETVVEFTKHSKSRTEPITSLETNVEITKYSEDISEPILSRETNVEEVTKHSENKTEPIISLETNVEITKHSEDESEPVHSRETNVEFTKHSEDESESIHCQELNNLEFQTKHYVHDSIDSKEERTVFKSSFSSPGSGVTKKYTCQVIEEKVVIKEFEVIDDQWEMQPSIKTADKFLEVKVSESIEQENKNTQEHVFEQYEQGGRKTFDPGHTDAGASFCEEVYNLQIQPSEKKIKSSSTVVSSSSNSDDLCKTKGAATDHEQLNIDTGKTTPDSSYEIRGYKPQTLLPNGAQVYISYYDTSCGRIWLQQSCHFNTIHELTEEISTAAASAPVLHIVEKDAACLAQSSLDGFFYRASVMKELKDEVVVYFVDYGNFECIPMEQVRVIPKSLLRHEPLSYCFDLPKDTHRAALSLYSVIEEYLDQDLWVMYRICGEGSVSLFCGGVELFQDVGVLQYVSWPEKFVIELCSESPLRSVNEVKPGSMMHETSVLDAAGDDNIMIYSNPADQKLIAVECESGIMHPRIFEISPVASDVLDGSCLSSPSLSDSLSRKGTETGDSSSQTAVTSAQRREVNPKPDKPLLKDHETEKLSVKPRSEVRKRFLDSIQEVEEDQCTEYDVAPYIAKVVNISESPFFLWILKDEHFALSDYIDNCFKNQNFTKQVSSPFEGLICVSLLHNTRQRVRVLSVNAEDVTVEYIDQGKQGLVSKNHLWELSELLLNIPPLATKIFLPVTVLPGRESGAVIATGEATLSCKFVCVDLDGMSRPSEDGFYTLVFCPSIGDLGEHLVRNSLAACILWENLFSSGFVSHVKMMMAAKSKCLPSESEQDSGEY